MLKEFYNGKKILLTGHTGFKGSWLGLWLKLLGANVLGYALKPNTTPSMFEELKIEKEIETVYGDILDEKNLQATFDFFKPEIVFHLAAQPLVRLSYFEPKLTYKTNVIGTLNVLEAARMSNSVVSFINVTTDKCYENQEKNEGYCEDEPMGGYDMYSSSKGCVEIMSSSYRRSFLENGYYMATARAGNVIGGGDWASERLIPDCIRFINDNKPIEIRNPNAVRPWQHVLEPLSGYLLLGMLLYEEKNKYAQGYNFGPNKDSILKVKDVVNEVIKCYQKGNVVYNKADNLHEATLLMLNIEKANKELHWTPLYNVNQAIQLTVDWYKNYYQNNDNDMLNFTLNQIKNYEENIVWNKICAIK